MSSAEREVLRSDAEAFKPIARRTRVLFLCTGNACRSPMAEGLLRHLDPQHYEALSAGSHPASFVHPLSVRAMAEIGIDISGHSPRHIRQFLPGAFSGIQEAERQSATESAPIALPDVIVTLCDFARLHCPPFPSSVRFLHWPVFDPIVVQGSEDFRLSFFRGVRDELKARIEAAIKSGAF